MKKTLNIILVIVGIATIVFGIIVLCGASNGSNGEYATFGADFYTIVNNNADIIADNTNAILETVSQGFGFLLISMGLITSLRALIAVSNIKEVKEDIPEQTEEKSLEVQAE